MYAMDAAEMEVLHKLKESNNRSQRGIEHGDDSDAASSASRNRADVNAQADGRPASSRQSGCRGATLWHVAVGECAPCSSASVGRSGSLRLGSDLDPDSPIGALRIRACRYPLMAQAQLQISDQIDRAMAAKCRADEIFWMKQLTLAGENLVRS